MCVNYILHCQNSIGRKYTWVSELFICVEVRNKYVSKTEIATCHITQMGKTHPLNLIILIFCLYGISTVISNYYISIDYSFPLPYETYFPIYFEKHSAKFGVCAYYDVLIDLRLILRLAEIMSSHFEASLISLWRSWSFSKKYSRTCAITASTPKFSHCLVHKYPKFVWVLIAKGRFLVVSHYTK